MEKQVSLKHLDPGSNPGRPTIFFGGKMPEVTLFSVQVECISDDAYDRCVPVCGPDGSFYVRAFSFQEAADKVAPKVREMNLGKRKYEITGIYIRKGYID